MALLMKKNRGFTLFELVIVIIILAIIAIIPRLRWSESTLNLDTQTVTFIINLRYAQSLSMSRNERCRLKITLPDSYDLQDSHAAHLSIPAMNSTDTATLNNNISFGTLTNITDTIIFDSKGVPYSDLNPETPISDFITIVLQNNSVQTRAVKVTPYTGKVSL